MRFPRDAGSGSGVSSSEQPATATSCSSSPPDATPSLLLHQPGATGTRANVRDKRARSGVPRHATAPGNHGDGGADAQANPPVVPLAAPSWSSSAAQQAQLVQLNELQAKLDEQRQQTQELRAALEQQRTARGAHAQAAGRVARERILADDNVDKPPELQTAGEKLRTKTARFLCTHHQRGNGS